MGNYASIVQEFVDRMKFHTGPGQMLAGLNFREIPEVQVDGLKDFPFAMFFLPSVQEQYRVNRISGTMRLNLSITVARKPGSLVGLMVWVEKVLDALETARDGSGLPLMNLGGTSKPFDAEMANAFALDLSLTAQITLTVMPKPMNRGQRRTAD